MVLLSRRVQTAIHVGESFNVASQPTHLLILSPKSVDEVRRLQRFCFRSRQKCRVNDRILDNAAGDAEVRSQDVNVHIPNRQWLRQESTPYSAALLGFGKWKLDEEIQSAN